MNLLGLGIRMADEETGRLLSICIFWPEDSEANFYIKAPNTYARDKWIRELRKAATVTPEAMMSLSIVDLKQRCVASGLVEESDYSNDREQLEGKFLDYVESRGELRLQEPLAVRAARTESTTGLAKPSTPGHGARLLERVRAGMRGMVSLKKTRWQQEGWWRRVTAPWSQAWPPRRLHLLFTALWRSPHSQKPHGPPERFLVTRQW